MKPKVLLAQKHLGRYKLPENIYAEKEEGYDGHIKWESTEDLQVMMCQFREAVQKKEEDMVSGILESLGAAASETQLEHITSLVLSGSVEQLKEALLSAICIGSRPLAEFILCLFFDWPHEERSGCAESDAFPPHMTPLVLACINNNFALVECLLLRGHSVEMPHHKNCGCETCLRQPYAALASVQKVDIMRAVSSDAFLWLATDDPFSAACSLAADLERFMLEENLEFTEWYKGLYQAVQHFATRIVNQNWSEQELDLFLSHRCYCDLWTAELPYPRVQMALDSGMRDFVASTNVQRSMDEIWWRGWGDFGVNMKRDAYRMLRHTIFYPLLVLLYISSNGKLARSFDVPLGRYITNCFSYLLFLGCLIFVRYYRATEEEHIDTHLALEGYVYFYIIGMVAERYLMFMRNGFRVHFQFWWRWFDFFLLGLFLLAGHAWTTRLAVSYDRQLPLSHRKYMDPWDNGLFYDVWISTGCILAIWRIFYYFQLDKRFGPSVISVGRCVGYVYNYLVISIVLIFAFAVGLTMLQQPYISSRAKLEDLKEPDLGDQFSDLMHGIRNLFWASFGYMEFSGYTITVGNVGPEHEPQSHRVTSIATELLIALYHVIVVITLLNLMVSLLVKKADEVLDNEEMEFKYIRVVLFSEYLHWSSAVPPPFNLLLMAKELLVRLISRSYVKQWPEAFVKKGLLESQSEEECLAYQRLLKRAFMRFRASKEYHYKSVFRAEGATKPTFAVAKVAFMSAGSGDEPRRAIDFNETLRRLAEPKSKRKNPSS